MEFKILIENTYINSDVDGWINLTDIYNIKEYPWGKRPSYWRNSKSKYLLENGHMYRVNGDGGGTFGDSVASIEYAKWLGLSVHGEGITLVSKRPEKVFGEYLRQIFPDLVCQKMYSNGKYFVDFYIPSLKLNIEYDEKFHKYKIDCDEERQKEIGGEFYRVSEGKEVAALIYLKKLKHNQADTKFVERNK